MYRVDTRYFNRHEPTISMFNWIWIVHPLNEMSRGTKYWYEPIEDEL